MLGQWRPVGYTIWQRWAEGKVLGFFLILIPWTREIMMTADKLNTTLCYKLFKARTFHDTMTLVTAVRCNCLLSSIHSSKPAQQNDLIYCLSSLSFFTLGPPSSSSSVLSLILLFLALLCRLLTDSACGIFMDFPVPSRAFASRLSLAMRSSIAFGVAPVYENSESVHRK